MRIHLTPKKGGRRLAGAAVAVSALAMLLGLIPAASAHTVTRADPAAAAAPRSSTCRWLPTPAQVWLTDPTNSPVGLIGGIYGRPGSVGVAYRINGQFTHTTTMSFTAYDNLTDIPAANYVLNDRNIIPDPGSVNPFVPGTLVEGKPRHYTAWFWPDSIPVPAGLKNVVLYPTKPAAPGTGAARWNLAMRQYHPQPGYTQIGGMRQTKITAVSAATLKPVPCPLRAAGTYTRIQLASFAFHLKYWGPIQAPPEPKTGNKIYFTSAPAAIFLGLDGYPGPLPQSCLQYMVAGVPANEISVVTQHKVPEYFNNDLVTPTSVMKDYQIRYQSLAVNYFTLNTRLYNSLWTNTDDAVYTSNGEWVTVYLPAEPRLPASEAAQVRALAKAADFNVVQLPPRSVGPIARQLPYPSLAIRQKGISSSFPYSNLNLPCWSQTHNYRNWSDPKGPAYFAKYASNPRNNGPYYTDGLKMTFAQFISKYSKQ
jgi:hypothetical protein